MASLYPQDLDTFRRFVSGFDVLTASELNELIADAINLETEIGLEPGGVSGTVFGRLFSRGNISARWGAWHRINWESQNAPASSFGRTTAGFRVTFPGSSMRGVDTSWGEDTPTPFGALQGPLVTTGTNQRAQAPWRTVLSKAEELEARWVGMDGEGAEIGAIALTVRWGHLAWNIDT